LMSYENGTFRVKSKFGVLSIEASDLAAIGVNTEEGIVDIVIGTPTKDNRDRITGAIEYVREGELKIKTEYGYVVVNPLNKAAEIALSEVTTAEVTKPKAPVVSKEEMFKDKGISTDTFTIQVIDVVKDKSGELRVALSFINNWSNGAKFWLSEPEKHSYIVDDQGKQYSYVSSLGIPTESKELFPMKTPVRFWFTFQKIEKPISSFSFFSTIVQQYGGSMEVKVIIPDIPVP
jgi:hypothetical protein